MLRYVHHYSTLWVSFLQSAHESARRAAASTDAEEAAYWTRWTSLDCARVLWSD